MRVYLLLLPIRRLIFSSSCVQVYRYTPPPTRSLLIFPLLFSSSLPRRPSPPSLVNEILRRTKLGVVRRRRRSLIGTVYNILILALEWNIRYLDIIYYIPKIGMHIIQYIWVQYRLLSHPQSVRTTGH